MLRPYPLREHDEYSVAFVTDQGIHYIVYFIDYSAMFSDYPEIEGKVFMFNIDVLDGDPDTVMSDERIGLTVMEVFGVFFKNMENVAVYVCDSNG